MQRVESIGVMGVALAGILAAAAAVLGMLPVAPPQVVEGFIALLAITKVAAAGAGLLAYAGRAMPGWSGSAAPVVR